MYHNVVIGTPLVEPWELLAFDKEEWEANEKAQTLFTETRNLAKVMVEAGLAPSIGEVRRNKPELYVELHQPNFFRIKWGKKFLVVVVGSDIPEEQFGEPEFSGYSWPVQKKAEGKTRVAACRNMEEAFKTTDEIQRMSNKEWKRYITNTLSAAGTIYPRDWKFVVTAEKGGVLRKFAVGHVLYPSSVQLDMKRFYLMSNIQVVLYERPWNSEKKWVPIAVYNGEDKWMQPVTA